MDESIGAPSFSSSESITSAEHSDDAFTSITNLPGPERDNQARHPHFPDRRTSAFATVTEQVPPTVTEQVPQQSVTDGSCSAVAVALTFSFFVSMIMILGVYGSANLLLGPNSSILIQPNPLFVKHIKVERLEEGQEAANQPTFYGFHETPALNDVAWGSKMDKLALPSSTHEEWAYFLNPGSQINVSYTIISSPSSALVLVIAQGNEGLSKWLEDPASPDSTLSWKIIKGSGMIQLDIFTSSSYYVAAGNLNAEVVEVELNVSIRASLYNTSKAYYECSLIHGDCSLDLSFAGENIALLTTPGSPGWWYVKLSYRPRWLTYLLLICGMTVLMSTVLYLLNNSQCTSGNRVQVGGMESERTPLLSNKDVDLSSWGSLCDSVSQDEDLEDGHAVGSLEGKTAQDCEYDNTRHVCAICFDAPRDCFFLPCGHCAACFACGKRIAEAAGTCPICRRQLKKVRRILVV